MFVPIDVLKPILADLVQDRAPCRTGAAVAGRGRRRGAGPAGGLARVARRPGRPGRARVGDIILGVGGEGVRTQAEFYRKVWGRGGAGTDIPLRVLQGVDVKELAVHSIDRVEYFRPRTRTDDASLATAESARRRSRRPASA